MAPGWGVGTRLRRAGQRLQFTAWSSATGEGRQNAEKLQALESAHRGRRCFIMGNGPSLLKCDLNRLAPEVTIVSNAHYLIWDQLDYVPTFLTVEDRLVAEDRGAEIAKLSGIAKVLPFDLRYAVGTHDPSAVYIHFDRQYPDFPRFSFDLRTGAFWGGTVSFLNLQLAAFLGCNPIVLVGFDHSYQVPAEGVVNTVITSHEADVNHFHPNYFGPGYRWHDPKVDRMEAAYRHARRVLEDAGVTVVNATVGGHLDVFTRVEYEGLF